ncbi:hypothetical protein BDN71DRAFT_1445736, partial [Pleurotus eryngii]
MTEVLDSSNSFDLRRRKELLTLVKHLRAIGYVSARSSIADVTSSYRAQTDLDLPRVTVIGNQSAGEY